MKHILKVLEKELQRRTESAKKMWTRYEEVCDENKRLKQENESLRKDLFDFSLNYFKNKEDAKTEE
jgi:regulator of replication initiation timing